jgi:hypothetical protein
MHWTLSYLRLAQDGTPYGADQDLILGHVIA